MIWEQLLDELCTAVKYHDTLKLAVFLLKIIEQQDMEEFELEKTKLDFTLIQSSLEDAERGNKSHHGDDSSSEYFQQFFLICMDLLVSLKLKNIDNQIKYEIDLINLLSKRLLDDPSFYLTPIIIVAKNLRRTVFKAHPPTDEIYSIDSQSNIIVDNFTNSIQRPFKLLISNKSDNKINISAIHIFASHLFSIYFKYNKLNAVINLYKVLSNTILSDTSTSNNRIDYTPLLNTQSIFDYFIGLALLIQSNYEKSYNYFKSSYENKHSKSFNLKILFYLLPLNYLISKKLPTNAFFEKFPDLKLLESLYKCVKMLDLNEYNVNLEKFKFILLKFKVFSIYIKFQTLIQSSIVKTTYEIYRQNLSLEELDKAHIVPISIFTTGMNVMRSSNISPIRTDEATECLLCRLIATGHIKGYLSHAKQVIVLSKSVPFPQ